MLYSRSPAVTLGVMVCWLALAAGYVATALVAIALLRGGAAAERDDLRSREDDPEAGEAPSRAA